MANYWIVNYWIAKLLTIGWSTIGLRCHLISRPSIGDYLIDGRRSCSCCDPLLSYYFHSFSICICPKFHLYLFKLQNRFIKFVKYIWLILS